MKYIDYKAALAMIRGLAKAKGFYGRMLRELERNKECARLFAIWLDERKFKDEIDLILAIEG